MVMKLGNYPGPSALFFLVGALCAVCASSAAGAPSQPANKKASPATQAVLNYFHTLSDQKGGKRIVSGQFSDFGRGANLGIMTQISEKTGKCPGLLGVDYADFSKGGITTENPNKAAIEFWKSGGLVTISAHMYNPANPSGGGLRDKGVNLEDLLKPGTETNQRWMRQLDQIADGLTELKSAGVVVLWRPFHEVNGGWFWWGDRDPQAFINVWRQMFEYYSNSKNLDNLIWVYSPNHGKNTTTFYAGDDYVDLVGLDAYTDFIDNQHIRGYSELVALGKPIGFTEFGPHDAQKPPGDYDYLQFVNGLEKEFPQVCFFMCWNSKWGLTWNKNVTELLANPAIITRSDLPVFVKNK